MSNACCRTTRNHNLPPRFSWNLLRPLSSWNTSVCYGRDDRGFGIWFPSETETLLFFQSSPTCFGAHKTYYPVVTAGSSTGIKQCGREPDHSSVSGAETNNTSKYNCIPPHVFTHFLGLITDLLLARIALNLLAFGNNTTQSFNRRTLDIKHRAQHNILISEFVNRIIR
jgi:hypothetical protein